MPKSAQLARRLHERRARQAGIRLADDLVSLAEITPQIEAFVHRFARRLPAVSALFLAISVLAGTPAQALDWARFKVYNRTDKCAYMNIQFQMNGTGWKNREHFLLKPNQSQDVTFQDQSWQEVRAQAHVYDTEKCGGPTIAETYDDISRGTAKVGSDNWIYPAVLRRRPNLKYMLYFEKDSAR
jgi:hypothetical protein